MKNTKKLLCILLSALLLVSFAACGAKDGGTTAVNIRDKLESLFVRDDAIGLDGTYQSLEDVQDGKIDEALVGAWATADGQMIYTFNEDGTATAKVYADGEETEIRYTCLSRDAYNVICEEVPMMSYSDDSDEPEESMVLSYTAYEIDNDALYQVSVEEVEGSETSFQARVIVMYRTDETGSVAAAAAKNPLAMDSFYGTWVCEKATIVIDENGLTIGDDAYNLSINDQGQLTAEKDGASTTYNIALSILKTYVDNTKAEVENQDCSLFLSFTGKDENDKPNLAAALDDWKTEYDWDSWYYTGNFTLQK